MKRIHFIRQIREIRQYLKSLSINKTDRILLFNVTNSLFKRIVKRRHRYASTYYSSLLLMNETSNYDRIFLYDSLLEMHKDEKVSIIKILLKRLNDDGSLYIYEHLNEDKMYEMINIIESLRTVQYRYHKTNKYGSEIIQIIINKEVRANERN